MGPAFGPAPFAYGAGMRRPLTVLLVAFVLAACGGGGSGGGAKSSASTADDQREADAAVLQVSDLPAGFAERSASSSSSDSSASEAYQSSLDACLGSAIGHTATEFEADRTAKSKAKFKSSDGDVDAEVELYKEAKDVDEQMSALGVDSAIDCVVTAIKSSGSAGDAFTIDDVRVLDRPPAPAVGDKSVAVALEVTLTHAATGQQAVAEERVYTVQKGRAEVTLTVTQAAGGGDPAYVESALQTMVGRLP